MQNKKLLLIVNPNAGRMRAETALMYIVRAFTAAGYDVTVYPTAAPGDGEEKVAQCGGDYDLIVCYGGDGTLSETVNGISRLTDSLTAQSGEQGKRPVFSFIPAGTANDFACTVGMPSEIPKCVDKILNGSTRALDFGGFSGDGNSPRCFVYVAAFGLFTSVSYVVPQDMKKTFGHFAYIMEGIRQAVDIPAYKLSVEFGDTVITDEFVVGLVTNSTSVAGMFRIDRSKVKLDDGEFEMALIRNPGNPLVLSRVIMDLKAQKYDPEYVVSANVSKVKITSSTPVAWCLDGENGGVHNSVTVENLYHKGIIKI